MSVQVYGAEKVKFAPAYIALSDAMGAIKRHDPSAARDDLEIMTLYLERLNIADTVKKENVVDAISAAKERPSVDSLTALSSVLIQLENYVNPVDYAAMRKQFIKHVMPKYEKMAEAILQQDKIDLEKSFIAFNRAWAKRERVVHETSLGHYGRMETAIALLNVAKARSVISWDEIALQSDSLGATLDSFNLGQTIETTHRDMDLDDGIAILNTALSDYQLNKRDVGNQRLLEFIKNWPIFEGEVSTRAPSLYKKVESQLPLIIAAAGHEKSQADLSQLVSELSALNPSANYTAMDAALILLREGLEALLIVVALFSAMKATQQKTGQRWIILGAVIGLFASLVMAWGLVSFLPSNLAGHTREKLEGIVGICAVIMMLFVGVWLHSKSSLVSWTLFLKKQTTSAVAAGSFFSLATLSFLAVFREGAETVLFYAGILPKIELSQFFLGIGIALVSLILVAFVILKTSVKIPIPVLFKVFTWLIYFLGFKMLGLSIHALQLTGDVSTHVLNHVPTINAIGLYSTAETVIAHAIYITIVFISIIWQRKHNA
jgi:high-affinity iron transporter